MTMKRLDELERLIVEKFRLEMQRCDLTDELTPTQRVRDVNERIRTIERMTLEIWIELIPLLRQQQRAKRLTGTAKRQAKLEFDREIEKLNLKWTERAKGMFGPETSAESKSSSSKREVQEPSLVTHVVTPKHSRRSRLSLKPSSTAS